VSRETPLNGGYEYREQLGARASGQSVLSYLDGRYHHSSAEEWRARIESGQVRLDGATVRPEAPLLPGQILAWRRAPWREPDAPLSFAVLHRDSHLLGVLKPSGLPTVPAGGFLEHTLLWQVRRRYPEASPLHRLGRATTGVILFARTGEAARILAEAWRRGEVRKIYRALVQGAPAEDCFTVETPIGRVPHRRLGSIHAANPGGKPSLSRVTVLERRRDVTLVDVEIATGRPHQIRIHLAAAGHPLAGDPLYAPGGLPRENTDALPGDSGYLLHARLLAFRHPATDLPLEVEAPPPPLLRNFRGN
jgi:23S rRNA pseudouridine1911/1915/1917 synthase